MHPSFFCNYNTESHSKNYQVHYNPYSMEYNHQPSLIVADHENTNLKNIINVQKSSYINNNCVVVEDNKCIPSNRSSKKDRHSKINTARGPRDRRMRLSLDVAKKFFRLQDMLGFGKASNTIEWLIMKSKPAIRDLLSQQHSNSQRASCSSLIRSLNSSASSGSECEVLSDIDHDQYSLDQANVINNEKLITSGKSNKEKKKKVEHRGARKSVYIDHTLVKETREKARERARKRTSEKRNFKFGSSSDDQYTRVLIRPGLDKVIDQNTNRLGSWIPFGENQLHTATTTDHKQQPEYPSSSHSTHFKQAGNIAGENSSVMMSNHWMPSSLFNYHNNPAGSYSHDQHMQQHQFSDFQIQGKPWAGIHN